jgi:hypothetical protein
MIHRNRENLSQLQALLFVRTEHDWRSSCDRAIVFELMMTPNK